MDIGALTQNSSQGNPFAADGTQKSFREADFLAIMLTEITNQDPFQPTETAKLVEQMQQLQNLANSNYEKFRDDIGWAQDLMGQSVTVQQAGIPEGEADALRERGVNVDVGYGIVSGSVETYRTVGESVWVTVDGKDYPLDNVQRIDPPGARPGEMAGLADGLLGRNVTWIGDDGVTPERGQVSDISWSADGAVTVTVGGERIPFERIRSIGQ